MQGSAEKRIVYMSKTIMLTWTMAFIMSSSMNRKKKRVQCSRRVAVNLKARNLLILAKIHNKSHHLTTK